MTPEELRKSQQDRYGVIPEPTPTPKQERQETRIMRVTAPLNALGIDAKYENKEIPEQLKRDWAERQKS